MATSLEGRAFDKWQDLKPHAAAANAALAAVHTAGVMHGDLRPQAFCLAENGAIVILDFDRASASPQLKELEAEKAALTGFLQE